MPKFIVTTHEDVAGTYLVEADTEREAKALFGDPRIMWDHGAVEQTDYMAYSCRVEGVAPAGGVAGERGR